MIMIILLFFFIIIHKKSSLQPFGQREPTLLKTAATYSPTDAVPSARRGLTALFGMGRGGTPAL